VTVAEGYADGLVDRNALTTSGQAAETVWGSTLGAGGRVEDFGAYGAWATLNPGNATQVARVAAISTSTHKAAAPELPDADRLPAALAECEAQAVLLREMFGNPFRPVTIDPTWLTPKVVDLARQLYEEQGFDRIPDLAQALEEAGCTNKALLEHCRMQEGHVKGCWVVDLLLGKS
jgi:hypothetical protein